MKKFVGVKSPLSLFFSPSLKREALMFGRIAIPRLSDFLADSGCMKAIQNSLISELDFLLNKAIVFEPQEYDNVTQILKGTDYESYWKSFYMMLCEVNKQMDRADSKKDIHNLAIQNNESLRDAKIGATWLYLMDDVDDKVYLSSDFQARWVSLQLRMLESLDAYPILINEIRSNDDSPMQKTDIVKIVLNTLPLPDESASWEQVIDFLSDPDTERKFLALRHWMSEVARGKLSSTEVEEKLAYLIDKYEQHLQLHRMRISTGTLETVVISVAGVIENLVKLNLEKAAKGLFAFKHRQIALMEGELTAPGNEIAYIVKARKTFSYP